MTDALMFASGDPLGQRGCWGWLLGAKWEFDDLMGLACHLFQQRQSPCFAMTP